MVAGLRARSRRSYTPALVDRKRSTGTRARGRRRTVWRWVVPAVVAAALASAVVASSGGASPARPAQTCTPKTNIEAIIDDSLSMQDNDPTRLRVLGLQFFIGTFGNEGKTLGAVEFAGDATTLFPPVNIGRFRGQMGTVLDTQIRNDESSTDYNAAFLRARADNPRADARIFLSDGGHQDSVEGPYLNLHRGGPPTYSVGFGGVAPGTAEANRMIQIASETGGVSFLQTNAENLQAVFQGISALLNCETPPRAYQDIFARRGQAKVHRLKIPRGTRKVLFGLSWLNLTDSFTIGGYRLTRNRKLVAGGRKRGLRARTRTGPTFRSVKLTGRRLARGGTLRFTVKASRLGASAKLTTQVVRSKRR